MTGSTHDSSWTIVRGDLDDARVIAMLGEHLAGMQASSPPGSCHALDMAGLSGPGIEFYTAWSGHDLLGCGALRRLTASSGEIKSMRTAAAHMRRGVASRVLDHLLGRARTLGYRRVSLETGSGPAFDAALALYQRYGFKVGGAFGDYLATDFSRFLHLDLGPGPCPMNLVVREEFPGDAPAIHRVNATAFETDAEALLVDALRAAGALTLSLVAMVDDGIVGHIAFSPVTVSSPDRSTRGLGLGPMAIVPAHQRTGIGGSLIAQGLRRLRDGQHPFCVVLGHADYYPRHGFSRASAFGIRWEIDVPDDVFFVQEITPGGLAGVSGVVRYRPEFSGV